MLLDNTKDAAADKTVAGWLLKHTESGDMDVVTGYFTVGALSWLSEHFRSKVSQFRIVWGGGADAVKVDLLTQEIRISDAVRLKKAAESAVRFLEREEVEVKIAEPDFCRAKMFLLNAEGGDRRKFAITGSSDLTEAGLGVRLTHGAELNSTIAGDGGEYDEFAEWFNGLWSNTQKVREAKQVFLDEIVKIFNDYTPHDVYMKIVSELLPEDVSQEKIEQRLGKTEIYRTLFDFQKKAVVSLVRMLEKKNGAILADAVGLGKMFTALAVIKYYRMLNMEVVVLTNMRQRHKWEQYTWHNGTLPADESFDYEIIFHSDLNEEALSDRIAYLTDEKPKLFVIDDSHSLRNDKDGRYHFLLEKLLRKNSDVRVLMLSATPINNSFLGLRNQFKLIGGFENVDAVFRRAQERLDEWAKEESPAIAALVGALRGIDGGSFLTLTDSVILSRTKKMVASAAISFPKHEKPMNVFEAPNCVEGAGTIAEIIDLLPVRFSAYIPAAYAGLASKRVDPDAGKKSFFIVKMMHIALAKRLESSWVSFKAAIEKILAYHVSVLQSLEKTDEFESYDLAEIMRDEDAPEFEEIAADKTKKVQMKDIKDVNRYEKNLTEDIDKLSGLLKELEKFSLAKDIKIRRLIEAVEGHIRNDNDSKKALIFTAYSDTAEYLFNCLRVYFGSRANVECVTSDTKDIDDTLKRFSPNTQSANESQLKRPIDILVATDVLGEGRNLRDCDWLANYDIHWNPLRAVQRIGRIDQLGNQDKTVRCVNFWPSKDIDEYLLLPERIEKRTAAMAVVGDETPDGVTDNNDKTDRVGALEYEQIKKSLVMLRDNIEDVEPESFGLSHLSLEGFRQDLTGEPVEKYKNLPCGVFSGFKAEKRRGLIALLQHRKNNDKKIAFINEQGADVLSSRQEILQFLHDNKDKQRYVPASIDNSDAAETDKLSQALKAWLESKLSAEIGVVMDGLFAGGRAALDMSPMQKAFLEEALATDNWKLICWDVVSGEE